MGELLFKVSGISGKASELDEDDTPAEATTAESSRRALLEVLGAERRDRILAALYLVRQDGVVVVRQAAMQIWKALVHNTPRTGMILSAVGALSSTNINLQSGRFCLNYLIKLYISSLLMSLSSKRFANPPSFGFYPPLTRTKTASRTVAEVCRKFGERILGEMMPILKTKAISTDARTREGVSLTISQIMYELSF